SANFEYHPNLDAVGFLVSEIWPAVKKAHPELRLRLVGRGDAFIRHLIPPGLDIELTGPVDDAFSEIAAARLVIAPLRAGSGTRIKILEAWAARRPVVATPLAAEGLSLEDGEQLILAEAPGAFAEAMNSLLSDPEARRRLGCSGRRLYEAKYTWQAAWRSLDSGLQMTASSELNRYTE
ncbi:MAG: glycosyltransferase family 4 protein, partial [Terriglobia bacterium]